MLATNSASDFTLRKCRARSSSSGSILTPYFFWISTPISSASMESSASPSSPNSGSFELISTGEMFSRNRLATMSSLSSASSTLIWYQLLETSGDLCGQIAGGARRRNGTRIDDRIDTLAHSHLIAWAAFGALVPFLALGQQKRHAAHCDQSDRCARTDGDIGKAAFEAALAARNGARSFREDHKVVASLKCGDAIAQRALRIAQIGNVVCRFDDAAHERIAPHTRFHHALRAIHQRHDEHHVEQRGMIGDDKCALFAAQKVVAFRVEVDDAQRHDDPDEEFPRQMDRALCGRGARFAVSKQQVDAGEHEYGEQKAADAEQQERDASPDLPPKALQTGDHAAAKHAAFSPTVSRTDPLRKASINSNAPRRPGPIKLASASSSVSASCRRSAIATPGT